MTPWDPDPWRCEILLTGVGQIIGKGADKRTAKRNAREQLLEKLLELNQKNSTELIEIELE